MQEGAEETICFGRVDVVLCRNFLLWICYIRLSLTSMGEEGCYILCSQNFRLTKLIIKKV